MNSDDARAVAKPISMAAVAALILGLAALILIPVAAGMHPIALILGIAAILVGVVAAVSTRRRSSGGAWLGYIAAIVGAIAVMVVAALALT